MDIKSDTIIGDIVRVNFKTAQLFEKNNIDFCCGGQISLEDACEKSGIDMKALIPELESLVQTSDPDSKYLESLELDALCEYIVKRHHTYVSENIPFLRQNLKKLCEVHGEGHPELFEVAKHFGEGADNLTMHMQKEEIILFPTITNMVNQKKDGNENSELGCGVLGPIDQMIFEHEAEGERFAKISQITNNYSPPADGCNTYQVTYKTLQEFEQDLHRHIHIENNILFKKAAALESE